MGSHINFSAFTKTRGDKRMLNHRRTHHTEPRQLKHNRDIQCVLSPSLIGSLKCCLRTDDVCTASVTYYLKSIEAMPDNDIRQVVSYLRNEQLTNHQVASRVRKRIPVLPDDRQINVRYALTEFIMNTLDPTFGRRRKFSSGSSDQSHTQEMRDLIFPEDLNQKVVYKANRSQTTLPLPVKGAKYRKTSQESPRSSASGTRKPSGLKVNVKEAPKKEKEVDTDEDEEDSKVTFVQFNNLRMKVKKDYLDAVPITRRSVSVVSHAMELQADSEQMAEAVALLHTFSASDVTSILEKERDWKEASSDEDEYSLKSKATVDIERSGAKSPHPEQDKTGKGLKKKKSNTAASVKKQQHDTQEKTDQKRKGSRKSSRSASACPTPESRATADSIQSGVCSAFADSNFSDMDLSSDQQSSQSKSRRGSVAQQGIDSEGAATGLDSVSGSGQSRDSSAERHGSISRKKTSSAGRHSVSSRHSNADRRSRENGISRQDPNLEPIDQSDIQIDDDDDVTSSVSMSSRPELDDRVRYMTVDLNDPFADCPKPPVAADNHAEATKYYESKGIANIFEMFLTRLVLDQPTHPLDYLIDLVGKMNRISRTSDQVDADNACADNPSVRASYAKRESDEARRTSSGGTWSTQLSSQATTDSGMPPVDT